MRVIAPNAVEAAEITFSNLMALELSVRKLEQYGICVGTCVGTKLASFSV
jgi:hypothetical protein